MSEISPHPTPPAFTATQRSGDVIDSHHHDEHQLIYVSAGMLAIHTGVGAWAVARDRAVWVPAGVWHEHRFHGMTSFHTVGFARGVSALSDAEPSIVAVDPLLRELVIAGSDPRLPAAEHDRVEAVIVDRLRHAVVRPLMLPNARDPRLADACALVEQDLSRPRTLAWLARHTATGERTLARLFRAEFGVTYPQWRISVRVFRAMLLLADEHTVTETAHACGWATASAFIDTFTRTMGQTPGRFRNPTGGPDIADGASR